MTGNSFKNRTAETYQSLKELRSFGFIVGGLLVVIDLVLTMACHKNHKISFLVTGGILISAGILRPVLLWPFYRIWMAIERLLGWFNTRIILTLIYFVLFVPTGIILRLLGKDPLKLKFHKNPSYRITKRARAAAHMGHTY